MREALLKEICRLNTDLWLQIAMTAFGLGVDYPDIERVINNRSPTEKHLKNWFKNLDEGVEMYVRLKHCSLSEKDRGKKSNEQICEQC